MSTATIPDLVTASPRERPLRFAPISGAKDRGIVLLAVHHVRIDGLTYTGGAEKYIRTVIRALLDAGAKVHVGYSGVSIYDDLVEEFDPRRLTVEHTGWIDDAISGDRRLSLGTIRERRRWLRASGADTVVAVQQAGGGAFVSSLVAARSLGFRVVASLRQEPPPLPRKTKRGGRLLPSLQLHRRRHIWRRRLPALCCNALIYNSRRVAEAYQTHYGFPEGRAFVICNGEIPLDSARRRIRSRPCSIASVGRVTEAKGADTLFQAFTILVRKHPHCRLTYYGEGPLIGALASRAREYGLADRIAFPGHAGDRDLFYRDVDILVQLSRRESMSNSVVEAMARGIPCVVSDVGGMPETVLHGRSGYVVPVGAPDACAEAIGRLLGDRDLYARVSEAALERARENFDIRQLMPETVRAILGIGRSAAGGTTTAQSQETLGGASSPSSPS